MTDIYDEAMREWVARRVGTTRDKISNVEFGTGSKGYCDTCYYEYETITFERDGRADDLGSLYDGPATIIREVSEIIAEWKLVS